jgi:hypothetical protein
MYTLPPRQIPPLRCQAAGLYHKKKTYMFRDYPERYIMIGRGSRCHIRSDSRYVSNVHAMLEIAGDARRLMNKSSLGYTFVDGLRVEQSMVLWVGNVIVLGNCKFMAVDDQGRFPISCYGITDMCCKAADICGTLRAAGRYLGKDHSYVKRRLEKAAR